MSLPEISEKEMRFVEEYCSDRNVVRSAMAAGYSITYQGAADAGRKLLKKSEIKSWVKYVLRRSANMLKFRSTDVIKSWQRARLSHLNLFVLNEVTGRVETAPGVPLEYIQTVRKAEFTTREIPRGEDLEPLIERKVKIELRDPFGPECKLMEHFGELVKDDINGESGGNAVAGLDILGRVAALIAGRITGPESITSSAPRPEDDAALDAEASAGGSVSE